MQSLIICENMKLKETILFVFRYIITPVYSLFLLMSCEQKSQIPDIVDGIALPEKVDFNFHIKPILSDRCFACHGPDNNARKAGLRLDTEEGAFGELPENKGKYAIVKGNLSKSRLFYHINATHSEEIMPPPESNLKLSEYEKALIGRWIEQGAEWKKHWSFIPPQKPEIPKVSNTSFLKNEIDNFILQKLEKEGLRPSPLVSKEKLIRRISFDLTGLPPTVEEIDDFLKDNSPDAYEKVLDRLLHSPHFGERMAADWLDVARYADTHGYQDDMPREMSPWRDWVIQAFNKNLSYKDFVTWQLAGDLLPNATDEQILATGFLRNHAQSQEGGIIDEEYRVEYVADKVNTVGRAFLGLTVECSRCHDHKYDPIYQKEFYQLYAFFNSTPETGWIPYKGTPGPTLEVVSDNVKEQLKAVQQVIGEQEQKLVERRKQAENDFKTWEKTFKVNPNLFITKDLQKDLLIHLPFEDTLQDKYFDEREKKFKPITITTNRADKSIKGIVYGKKTLNIVEGKIGKAFQFDGDNLVALGKFSGDFERSDEFSLMAYIKLTQKKKDVPIIAKIEEFNDGQRGYELAVTDDTLYVRINHLYPYNCLVVKAKSPLPMNEWVHVGMSYDGSSRAEGIELYVNGKKIDKNIEINHLYRTIKTYNRSDNARNWDLQIGKRNFEGLNNKIISIDEVKIYGRKLSEVEMSFIAAQATGVSSAVLDTNSSLLDYFLDNYDKPYITQKAALKKARQAEEKIRHPLVEVMVMKDLPKPRATFVLHRGQYDAPIKEQQVFPETPKSVLPLGNYPKNRLGLAQWLFDDKNPLTARVYVNRLWLMMFGRGLVNTVEDFGNQGALPSHPELLDWLAVKFKESDWDIKKMLKLMAMSATYQQSSQIDLKVQEKDAENIFLAHAPNQRLTGEMMRDNILAVSGLLVRKIGGKSVKPYQPEGIFEITTSGRGVVAYEQGHGEDLYRRSLYTFWKRTVPPPAMITFDGAERNICVVKRQSTNTPLQSLVLLNDPQVIEASRVFAEKIMQKEKDTNKRLIYAFRSATSRMPKDKEIEVLKNLYDKEVANFKRNPQNAKALISIGEYKVNTTLSPVELAAMSVVVSTIFNTSEAIIKG
jgi:hypothetical protein